MQSDEMVYCQLRAEAELRRAHDAEDLSAAVAHRRLADLYFERLGQPAPGPAHEVSAFGAPMIAERGLIR